MTSNKSAHQLFSKKSRTLSDYLNLFNTRNYFEENNEIYNINNKGYKRLYNLNKLNKEKEEDYRQKMLKIRELNELSECSFVPKINKDFENKKENIFNNININNSNSNNQNLFTEKSSSYGNKGKSEEMTDLIISDLLKRQDEWIKKKNQKMEINKQLEKNRAKENLIFFPEINKNNQKIFNSMKIDTQEIVEDPESYKEYIDRNKKAQKNNEMNNIKELSKVRNITNKNNYDYTEHKLINKNFLNLNGSSKESKSVDMKKNFKNKNMIYTKSKINNINKINNEDIYSMIYLENKEKYENRKNEGFSEQEKKNIFY